MIVKKLVIGILTRDWYTSILNYPLNTYLKDSYYYLYYISSNIIILKNIKPMFMVKALIKRVSYFIY